MTDPIEYDPSRDPLYRDVPLRHTAEIPVLGVPVRFRSNAAAVIAAAEEAFGAWRVLQKHPALLQPDGVSVTIMVHPGDEGDAEHAEFYHRVLDGQRVLFGSRGSIGYTDPDRQEATAFVTPQLVRDRQHFRYTLLEGLTLMAVTPHDRQPFHAAALARNGAAVVLAGPSATGKSTLAYAAARAGLDVLAEDTVYLQADPVLRVWGLPGYIHLPADAGNRFPELRGRTPTLKANGKRKLAISLGDLGALPPLPVADRVTLCLLRRDPDGPALEPLDPDAAVEDLMRDIEPGFDMFATTIRRPLTRLAARGAWALSLPPDPAAAVPLIARLIDGLGTGG